MLQRCTKKNTIVKQKKTLNQFFVRFKIKLNQTWFLKKKLFKEKQK